MKNLIKDLIFLIIFIILFVICSNIFVLKGNGFGSDVTSFYNLEKNSLDIIFFGSSHSYSTFNPELIEKESGLKSYNFATQQQPIQITYYYMVEALKTQKPKYFVLESHMLTLDYDYAEEGTIRDALDKMKPSLNKFNAINAAVKNKEDRASYYINIIKYHSRYKELTTADIKEGLLQNGIDNNGYISLESKPEVMIDNKKILKQNSKKEIYYKNIEYLNKIIELAKENDIELILVKTPCQMTDETQAKVNWLVEYTKENNIDFIDYNKKIKELDIKTGDFYDTGHLSGSGSTKVSKNFVEYIQKREK
jgi:hypothetical protein